MLTDLSWLEPGERFPPRCECERMERYHQNKELFESEHAEVYAEQLKRIERVIGNFSEVVNYPVILNFQKLIALKVADLLVGEPPQISAGDNSDGNQSTEQLAVETIETVSDLNNLCYETALDVSRYGDGLFMVRLVGGIGRIESTQPQIWFPVVSPDNIKEVLYHVLAYIVPGKDDTIKQTLNVQVHSKGSFERRSYQLENGIIVKLLSKDTSPIPTGLDDFAIVHIPNTMTSDRVTGIDDFTDIDSIVSELMVRIGQISKILDKHANPTMEGPASALDRDPITHEWTFKTGNYLARNEETDPHASYVVWDGQLSANFTEIEKLTNMLYTISEMGSAIFGDMSNTTGQVASGSALRRLMVSPLAKVARIRSRFDPAIKKAIKLCSQLGGKGIVNLTDTPITITWQDGLPGDPVEEADIMAKRTANKATMSVHRALTQYDAMTDEDADIEQGRIADEEAELMPITTAPPFSANNSADGG